MNPNKLLKRGAPRATELIRHLESGASIGRANVVLSRPPAGFSRGPHEHRHAYVSVTLSGGWRETYRGRPRECGPGALAVYLPEATHSRLHTEPGTCELYLEVEPGELPERWAEGAESARWSAARPLMHALFVDLTLGCDLPLHFEALAAQLLVELFGPSARTAPPSHAWIRSVRDAIEDDLDHTTTLRTLSRRIGTHPSHLARCFRAAYGLSVGQYAQRIRIGRALDAMHRSDRPLVSIAAETGFSDQSHLGRVFLRHIGISPGHYRRLLRG